MSLKYWELFILANIIFDGRVPMHDVIAEILALDNVIFKIVMQHHINKNKYVDSSIIIIFDDTKKKCHFPCIFA